MDALKSFSLPIKGLGDGIHRFDFEIDREFFSNFEASLVKDGNVHVVLVFDKRPNMFVLDFEIEGTVSTTCDRCLAGIQLPITASNRLFVKFSEDKEDENVDVIYISMEDHELKIAQEVYEYISLAIPITKVFDCESLETPPCDFEMLEKLHENQLMTDAPNPIWDALKDLDLKNKEKK